MFVKLIAVCWLYIDELPRLWKRYQYYDRLPFDSPIQVNDRIVYYRNIDGVHATTYSGIVVEVDSQGYATKVSSKMGVYEIIEHHPRDIPSVYGNPSPWIYYPNSTRQSREYLEKPQIKLNFMRHILILLSVFIVNLVNAQETKLFQTAERKSLDTLLHLKVEYDRLLHFEKESGKDLNSGAAYEKYRAYIKKIKKEPTKSKLMNFTDQVIKQDSTYLKETIQVYSFINKLLPDRTLIISNMDYYRIVNYFFEKDLDELPPLENIPFIKKEKWRMPTRDDIKGIDK